MLFQSGSFGTMPNLGSLELELGGDNADLDLSSLLRFNPALRRLHLHLSDEVAAAARESGDKYEEKSFLNNYRTCVN